MKTELIDMISTHRVEFKEDIADLQVELKGSNANLRAAFKVDNPSLRAEMRKSIYTVGLIQFLSIVGSVTGIVVFICLIRHSRILCILH